MHLSHNFFIRAATWSLVAAGFVLVHPLKGQEPVKPVETKEVEIPVPQDHALRTSDGLEIRCTYYKPVYKEGVEEPGKRTLPFILLHDWEGDRRDFHVLALQLQQAGCAVVVPDFRGHGESIKTGDAVLDLKKFRKAEMTNMINDIEACKKFLVQRNNEGELNIDLLNVVAIGQSNLLAMNWIIRDWYGFPPFHGSIKQGQDVKSLTMVIPEKKMGPLNMTQELKHPMFSGHNPGIPNLPTLVIWCDDDSAQSKESASIFEIMKKGRPDLTKIADPTERANRETLFDVVIPNLKVSGADLLNRSEATRDTIMEFVAVKVGAKRDDHVWMSRSAKE
jgi:hypothetical protein